MQSLFAALLISISLLSFSCQKISALFVPGNEYVSDRYGFSLKYPKGWQVNDTGVLNSAVIFVNGDWPSQIKPSINIHVLPNEGLSLEQYVSRSKKGMLNDIAQIGYKFREMLEEKKIKLTGQSALSLTYLFNQNGLDYKGSALYIMGGDRVFIIFFTASRNDFLKFERDFANLIKTFKIQR